MKIPIWKWQGYLSRQLTKEHMHLIKTRIRRGSASLVIRSCKLKQQHLAIKSSVFLDTWLSELKTHRPRSLHRNAYSRFNGAKTWTQSRCTSAGEPGTRCTGLRLSDDAWKIKGEPLTDRSNWREQIWRFTYCIIPAGCHTGKGKMSHCKDQNCRELMGEEGRMSKWKTETLSSEITILIKL